MGNNHINYTGCEYFLVISKCDRTFHCISKFNLFILIFLTWAYLTDLEVEVTTMSKFFGGRSDSESSSESESSSDEEIQVKAVVSIFV